jgi:hypothetical protein
MVASPEGGSPTLEVDGSCEVEVDVPDTGVVDTVEIGAGVGADAEVLGAVGANVVGALVACVVVVGATPPHHVFVDHAKQYDFNTSWHTPSPNMQPSHEPHAVGADDDDGAVVD